MRLLHDPLLDSIEEHAKLFVAEHPDLPYAEMHEYLEGALERGLMKFDVARGKKEEGVHTEDDPVDSVQEAADRVLHRPGPRRWDFAD